MGDTTESEKKSPPLGGLWARIGLVVGVLVVAVVVLFAGRHYFGWFRAPGGGVPVAAPAVGGPFTLVNQDGKPVTNADFRGKYMLIYFGYTFCPDVCPTALTEVGQALDKLGKDADKLVPIFITVDPERDRPVHLKEYVAFFHPRMQGLSGSVEQVASAAKAYRVYYAKAREKGSGDDDYLMDHTSITYLMGPDGKFLAHFGHGTSADAIAERIRKLL
jgi:protein SCO1/2